VSLAQVVYNMSTDNEFSTQWNIDPETALAEKGLHLGRAEMAILSSGMNYGRHGDENQVRLSELALISRGWK